MHISYFEEQGFAEALARLIMENGKMRPEFTTFRYALFPMLEPSQPHILHIFEVLLPKKEGREIGFFICFGFPICEISALSKWRLLWLLRQAR